MKPYNGCMAAPTPMEVRDHLAALALAAAHEIEELRRTPVETKLRQLQAMMGIARLLESDEQRAAEEREARARWARLHQALRA